MSKSARRLGRGLDSLVSNLRSESTSVLADDLEQVGEKERPRLSVAGREVNAAMLRVEDLNPNPFQPRDSADALDVTSLAHSIRQSGMLQPIAARHRDGQYQIIAGERRWHAARSIGLTRVPVIIRDATDEQMLELALIENIQREDLNAIDRAKAYREFCSRFSLQPEEVANRLGEDRTTVVNYMRLLDLPVAIRKMVADRRLSMGHARCLLGIADDAHRLCLAESATHNELSVRALEEIVRREKTRQSPATPAESQGQNARSAHLRELQQRFEEALKTKVTIHEGKRKGAGRIVVEYYSLDDFDRIAAKLDVKLE